jgi:hypothetical protein
MTHQHSMWLTPSGRTSIAQQPVKRLTQVSVVFWAVPCHDFYRDALAS